MDVVIQIWFDYFYYLCLVTLSTTKLMLTRKSFTWWGSSPWSRRRWTQGKACHCTSVGLTLAIVPNMDESDV